MCEQWKKALNLPNGQAPANHEKREILPVATDTGRVYNGSAGKKVGALTGKEKGTCDGVKEISTLFSELSEKHQNQLISLIDFLAASFDEQQREQYLSQLLKEI